MKFSLKAKTAYIAGRRAGAQTPLFSQADAQAVPRQYGYVSAGP